MNTQDLGKRFFKGLGVLSLALLMSATAHAQPTTRQRLARIEARRSDPEGFAAAQRRAAVRAAAVEGRLSLAAEADYLQEEIARGGFGAGMAALGVRDGIPVVFDQTPTKFTREPHRYVPVDRPNRVQARQGPIQHPQMTPVLRPTGGMTRYLRGPLGDVIPEYLTPPGKRSMYHYVGTR